MSVRWPDLELLRPRDSDLLTLSPLTQARARDQMTAALRTLKPALAHLDDNGPDAAIIDALAACIQIMGFYHDRFLTESKLGSAQLIDDLGKIVALIGYRPLPAVAATAYQFFEAITAGIVEGHTQVAGTLAGAPAPVTFETTTRIEVSPDHNRMALSPLITTSPGALRAVITQPDGSVLPTDDFRAGTTAMIADAQGLELAPVDDSRSRGVAFGRALSRSYEQASTVIERTTVLRHLRFPRALTPDLVAFEVSEAPILHLPSVAAPEVLTSTLEIFVLREGDDAIDPSEWAATLRYREVADFSASEAADPHHRTFVDDALHTWIILRTSLGAQRLLDDQQLSRVYARFQPAIGSVLPVPPAATTTAQPVEGPSPRPDLSGATLGLEPGYFRSSLVLPSLADRRVIANATWAMADRDLGLVAGDSILIQDASGSLVRTLIDRPPGASPRLLRWASDDAAAAIASPGLPQAHDPITRVLDPSSARIGSLTDAAAGDAFPTWSEFYAQLRPLGSFVRSTDLPIRPASPAAVIEQQRVIAAGATYLVVRDATHIAVGDFFLLGRRLTEVVRVPPASGDWRWSSDEPAFDPRTPWLDAEVLQALEVRGNVVRLATPVSQDYFVDRGRIGTTGTRVALSELVVLPGVGSVASGDQLRQTLTLSTQALFTNQRDGKSYETSYRLATLDHARPADQLRRALIGAASASKQDLWDVLFLAVAGAAEVQTDARWDFDIVVRCAALRAPADQITGLEDDDGDPLTTGPIGDALKSELKLRLVSADAARKVADAADHVVAVLANGPVWTPATGDPPNSAQFWVLDQTSFDLVVTSPAAERNLVGNAATLVIIPDDGGDASTFQASWDAAVDAPRVKAVVPEVTERFDAILISSQGTDLATLTSDDALADWRIPAARFVDPRFAALPAGTLVAATDQGEIVTDCRFAPGGSDVKLDDVRVVSNADPLLGATTAWAVVTRQFAQLTARASWVYTTAPGPALPPSTTVRLVLIGDRNEIVDARTSADGRTATIDPAPGVRDRDLGFELDAVCALEGTSLPGERIVESTIWAWRGLEPPLADLPEAADSRFLAVLASRDGHPRTLGWQRGEVWWDPERRTLRLPAAPPGAMLDARPSDIVRLVQLLAPSIDDRELAIHHDLTTDRSFVVLTMPPGWPSAALVPAPVVVATARDSGETEVHDLVAPVEVAIQLDGRVRWTLQLAGDLRRRAPDGSPGRGTRWTELAVALRDWSAPAERGLAVVPLWQVEAAAWRARAAAGPVVLIATLRDRPGFLALGAMPRLDGDALELAPLGPDDELPPAASVAGLDLAVFTAMATAEAPIVLRGSTQLEIDDAGDPPLPGVIAVAFENGTRWQPIDVIRSTPLPGGRQGYELDRAYLSLFPEGLLAGQRVRLCYAKTALATAAGGVPVPAAIPHTLRLRLPGTRWAGESSANAAVFDAADAPAGRVVLDTSSAPKRTSDALVLELAVDADRLGEIFDGHGALIRSRLDLAQRWRGLHRDALVAQRLSVVLGESPYELVKGDVVTVSFGYRPPEPVTVLSAGNGVVVLDTLETLPVLEIALHGLRTHVDPVDYSATLDLAPSSSQPPWLLSFSGDPGPSSLLDTLLPYDAAPTASPDGSRQLFRFSRSRELVDIFRNAGDPRKPLYLLTNQRDDLRRDFYTGSDDQVASDLADVPLPINFLDPQATAPVAQLVVTASAWAARHLDQPGPVLDKPRPVLVSSTRWTPLVGSPRMPADQFPELAVVSSTARRVPTGIVLQSSRFNSGNFIAGVSQGTAPATAAAIIASALRVSAQPLDRDGNPVGPGWKSVGYAPLAELGHIGRPSGSVTEFEGLTYHDAVDKGLLPSADHLYAFSTSFSPTGTCTLHFLFVDKLIVDTVRVRIEAQYNVDPGRTDSGLRDPIYPLETAVVAFDPAHQLALLAPGALKPGALLFVRVQQRPGDIDLQWTSVAGVTGPVVDLASPIAYGATAAIEPIAVTGVGKLTSAARLDAEYYTTVARAKLTPDALVLPLRDRLPLRAIRTVADRPSLVSSLVPGDVVLVFDERWRSAWAAHRGADTGQPAADDWWQWPDRQYEAVVKRVDPDSGLVLLATPLPDSVQIGWTHDQDTGQLTPVDEDITALRVLPGYRAPVQGPRVLAALGSGSAQKFARFTSSLDAGTGSAVLPVLVDGSAPAPALADGITTGNIEVLAFDPVKAAWSRWLRHDRLSRAGKKDPAVTLGFRPASAGQIPVSVTFGDGVTGQLPPTGTGNIYLRSTAIGAAKRWLAAPRNVRIVALPVPGATSPIARQPSLTLRLETAAPRVLSGAPDLGSAQWRSALALTVQRLDGSALELREITRGEAADGIAGFVLDARPDTPPGTVDAYVYTPVALAASPAVVAQQAPGTRPWTLDPSFYEKLSDGHDLTIARGARSLQLLSTTGLRTGSRLAMFHDDASPPDLVRIASVDPPTWSATLVDPLPRVYDLARSFIRGNLVPIIQGVVETITLGSSDGTTPSLRLPLQTQQRLLHVVDPDGAPRPDITVLVAGQRWDRVLDFTGQAPTSRVWRLDFDTRGNAFVVFGDGVQGAIPPAGRDTIAAAVRLGSGAAGNLPAGAITKLVSGNLAIKSTTSITPSAGGSAGDEPPAARDKAFAHTLPSERVVSAADCVRAAIGESGVINAALDPTAPPGKVQLVVAMEDRRVPTPADITAITRQVTDVMPAAAGVVLEVARAIQTPVHLVIELGVAKGAEPGDVFAAVTTALGTGDGGLFAAAAWEVGEPLRLGTLYDTLFQIDGVAHARVLWMAGKPLLDGAPPPASVPDIFDPGPLGVVRCDNAPGGSGTFRLVQAPVELIA